MDDWRECLRQDTSGSNLLHLAVRFSGASAGVGGLEVLDAVLAALGHVQIRRAAVITGNARGLTPLDCLAFAPIWERNPIEGRAVLRRLLDLGATLEPQARIRAHAHSCRSGCRRSRTQLVVV